MNIFCFFCACVCVSENKIKVFFLKKKCSPVYGYGILVNLPGV